MDLFTLVSSSRRPDSERLLYQSNPQVLRPPTAPLTPNAPPATSNGKAADFIGELIAADTAWFMPSSNSTLVEQHDGLPPPPSHPPTLNLFESLNRPSDVDKSPRSSDYWAADARLNHIVEYLQQRNRGQSPEQVCDQYSAFGEWPSAPSPGDITSGAVYTPVVGKQTPQSARTRNTAAASRSPVKTVSGNRSRSNAQARAPVKGWWKTEICKFWKESGGCRNDNNCRWAHGDQELRSPSPDPVECASNVEPWLLIDDFAPNLQTIWELLKNKNQSMRQVEENVLIGGPSPNIILDATYWSEIGEMLMGDNFTACITCGDPIETGADGQKNPLLVCSTCMTIAAEKMQSMSLIPQSSSGSAASPSHNDKKKLVHWGLSLAK